MTVRPTYHSTLRRVGGRPRSRSRSSSEQRMRYHRSSKRKPSRRSTSRRMSRAMATKILAGVGIAGIATFTYQNWDLIKRAVIAVKPTQKGTPNGSRETARGNEMRDVSTAVQTVRRRRRRNSVSVNERKRNYDEVKQQQLEFCKTRYIPTENKIHIGGEWIFQLSNIIVHPNQGRRFAILYVSNSSAINRCHLLYRSKSDGSWRVTPYVNYMGHFSKGGNRHYTQETKPHLTISQAAETLNAAISEPNISEADYDELLEKCSMDWLDIGYADKCFMEAVIEDTSDSELLRDLQNCKPGDCFMNKSMEQIKYDLQVANVRCEKMTDFVPDFHNVAKQTYKFNHTLLSEVTVEVYGAKLGTKNIEWHVAFDTHDRIWIDRIVYADVQTCEYGVYAQFINSGILTNKPLEYASQCGQFINHALLRETVLPESENYYVEFDGTYVDITPFLNKLYPINQYRIAKNKLRQRPSVCIPKSPPELHTLQSKDIGKYCKGAPFLNSNLTGTIVSLNADRLPSTFTTDRLLPISLRNTAMIPQDSKTLYMDVWYAVYGYNRQVSGWFPFQVHRQYTLSHQEPLHITTQIHTSYDNSLLGTDCSNKLSTSLQVQSIDEVIEGYAYGVLRTSGKWTYAKVTPQTDTEHLIVEVDKYRNTKTFGPNEARGQLFKICHSHTLSITASSELLRRKTPGVVTLENVRIITERGNLVDTS